jgi:3-oxoacyl-[acyl-carrier protein] reductase
MDLGLQGAATLVTAGSQGIGLAVATEFLKEGARVLLTSRNAEHLEKARAQLGPSDRLRLQVGDVTDGKQCQAMVAACQENWGRLDVLFANAGGPPAGSFFELEPEQFQRAIDLNLFSIVHLTRAAVPIMKAQSYGRIVALTSLSVKQPVDGLMLSNMARAGAQGFLKTLSNEVARFGITVNTVGPGYTQTERLRQLAEALAAKEGLSMEKVLDGMAAKTAAQRLGDPDEIAAMVAFLASRRAGYVNGTFIPVDGGAVRSLL